MLGLAAPPSLPAGLESAPNKPENMPKGGFGMGTLMGLSKVGLALAGLWIIATSIAIYLVRHLNRGHKVNRRIAIEAIVAASVALALAILMWQYPVMPRAQFLLQAQATIQPGVEPLIQQAQAAAQQPIIVVTPSEPVSGILGQSGQVYFSINVPDDSESLVITVKGSPEADLEVEVFEGSKLISKGSIDKPVKIQNPEATTYYILLVSQRASTSFTLLAEIGGSAPKSSMLESGHNY
jgi:hypothetical protein